MSTTGKMTAEDYANLSDEEIMGMASAPVIDGLQVEEPDEDEESGAAGSDGGTDAGAAAALGSSDEQPADESNGDADEDGEPGADGDASEEGEGKAQGSQDPADVSAPNDPSKVKPEGEKPKDKAEEDSSAKPADGIDYKAAYEQIMAPFKANGKEIKLQSVDEAVRLMQMGANYTKKLQALQPNLKLLKMMENNGLLDEGKLSYLIDLDKKNPAAIQKLLRDSGVDPLDIDTTKEPSYKPGNYQVSDEQMAFSTTLEEVASDPAGQQVVVAINRTWDEGSKREVYKDPSILRILTEQKQNGIYDAITSEMERRRVLGTLSNTMPFLRAYMAVGRELDESGKLTRTNAAPAAQGNPGQQPASQVVETRAATRKQAPNNDKAKAASSVSSTPPKAKQEYNPLALSDEEFMKNADLAQRL